MCGIFLNMNKEVNVKFMSNMFVMDMLRGKDSCGLVTVTLDEPETFKDTLPAVNFVKQKKYEKLFWGNTRAAIGHNRAATAGVINARNAHPFTIGNITGVHNGTLLAQWRLPDDDKFTVDSENIIHSIDKIGIDETWKLIDGAAALIWYDKGDNTINFIRNDERELYWTVGAKGAVYAASEKFMMLAAMERNSLSWTDVELVPENVLFSIDVETRKVSQRPLEAGDYGYSAGYYTGYSYSPKARDKGFTTTAFIPKSNRIGEKVEFHVDYIEHHARCTYYYVSDILDSNGSSYYTIEDYRGELKLKAGDCGTSTILSKYAGETFLSTRDVVLTEDDIPSDTDTFCNWCSAPINAGANYVIDSEGTIYCDVCADIPEVKEYLGNNVVEVVA